MDPDWRNPRYGLERLSGAYPAAHLNRNYCSCSASSEFENNHCQITIPANLSASSARSKKSIPPRSQCLLFREKLVRQPLSSLLQNLNPERVDFKLYLFLSSRWQWRHPHQAYLASHLWISKLARPNIFLSATYCSRI